MLINARHIIVLLAAFIVLARAAVASADVAASPIGTFFENHCIDCHGPDKAKSGFRVDTLTKDPSSIEKRQRIWVKVLDRIESGEMPPKKSPRPPRQELDQAVAWIHKALQSSEQRAIAAKPVRLRRLTRVQYENTMHDLLAINIALKNHLPEDGRAFGFDNVGDALTLSGAQIEAYLEAADAALDAAIVHRPRPDLIKHRYIAADAVVSGYERVNGHIMNLPDAVVIFGRQSFYVPGNSEGAFRAPMEGRYRVRCSAYAYQTQKMLVYVKATLNLVDQPIGFYDMPSGSPTVIEFTPYIKQGAYISFNLQTNYDVIRHRNPETDTNAGLAVQWIEIEGPLLESWPPPSHQSLFGDLPLAAKKGVTNQTSPLTVISEHPKEDAEKLLGKFMRRAFRRLVTPQDIEPYVEFALHDFQQNDNFEDAMRAAYKAVLASPDFLFFQEKVGSSDDFAIASRLSYFLWSTAPDETLLELAERGELRKPQVLRAQVDRMLQSPRAQAFVANFTSQWLDLRQLDFTTPDLKIYPEYNLADDTQLRLSIQQETELFFAAILNKNLSITNFIDSDFTFLNERLATLYGMNDIKGPAMRRVSLDPASHRGGILTQASIMKVTANGTTTSPVLRGSWVLRNILGRPPEPPPPDAGAIEPDLRGAKTIREQLEKHRRTPACASCHVKIDPLGFALENYDVLGGWRDKYRIITGAKLQMSKNGPKVDTNSGLELPTGQTVTNVDELKKYLLEDKDQLARSLAEKLLIYSTGRGMRFSDRAVIQQIVTNVRAQNYGLRAMIDEVVQSRSFLDP